MIKKLGLSLSEEGITIAGFLGGLSAMFGGWDIYLISLLSFQGIDLILGSLFVSLFFKKSNKTSTGGYSSSTFVQGLIKKFSCLFMVIMSVILDNLLGTSVIRSSVIMILIFNEAMSIVENLGVIGVPIPKQLKAALEFLSSKAETQDTDKNMNTQEDKQDDSSEERADGQD